MEGVLFEQKPFRFSFDRWFSMVDESPEPPLLFRIDVHFAEGRMLKGPFLFEIGAYLLNVISCVRKRASVPFYDREQMKTLVPDLRLLD